MKKLAIVLTAISTLVTPAFAQTNKSSNMGSGAQAASYASNDDLKWVIGLGALVVIGVVVGLAAGAGAQNSNSSN